MNADENEAVVDASGLEVDAARRGWPQLRAPAAPGVPAHAAPPRPHVGVLHRPAEVVTSPLMPWSEWIRTVEVEPSLYAADFAPSASRSRHCCAPTCRVFHFDVGDGHFVEPITMGPIVLQSISPLDPPLRRRDRRAPDGREPGEVLRGDRCGRRRQRRPSISRPSTTSRRRSPRRASTGCRSGVAFNPETEPESRCGRRGRGHRALHGDPSRLLGPAVPDETLRPVRRLRAALPPTRSRPGRRRRQRSQHPRDLRRRGDAARRWARDLRARGPPARVPPARPSLA